MKKIDKWLLSGFFIILATYFAIYYFVIWPSLIFNWPVSKSQITRPIINILDQKESVGIVVEGPIKLGSGLSLIGVTLGDSKDKRSYRAVLIPENRQIVVGQKIKVKSIIITETYLEAFSIRIIQD